MASPKVHFSAAWFHTIALQSIPYRNKLRIPCTAPPWLSTRGFKSIDKKVKYLFYRPFTFLRRRLLRCRAKKRQASRLVLFLPVKGGVAFCCTDKGWWNNVTRLTLKGSNRYSVLPLVVLTSPVTRTKKRQISIGICRFLFKPQAWYGITR